MISPAYITHWRQQSPWADNAQVEQDLILSRILVEIFNDPFLKQELAFHGGTALHKLFFSPAGRYSEDIDLVRTSKGPIKSIIRALRARLEPWLGEPKTIQTSRSFKLNYYFNPENSAIQKLRVKIEINIEESFSILDRINKEFTVSSPWFSGSTHINTFQFEELIATKLRALYQRAKGRDVFDLWLALKQELNTQQTAEIFLNYMKMNNQKITKKLFEKNLELKLQQHEFLDDIGILLSPELLKTHSKPIITENGDIMITEDGKARIATEGWSLIDAAEEIKNKILVWLP